MAVVVKNANKGIIFAFDGINEEWRILNLSTHFLSKPFDIKVLDNGGVDIAASGSSFISDIVFTDMQQKEKLSLDFYRDEENYQTYIKILSNVLERCSPRQRLYNTNKENMSIVDYEDPKNWALTYKMRGFNDVIGKPYPRRHPMMNSYTAAGLLKVIKKSHKYVKLSIKSKLSVKREHMPIFEKCYKMIGKRGYNYDLCLYVEHKPQLSYNNIEIRERILDTEVTARSTIVDFYNADNILFGTVIGISMSPSLTDYVIHSDEGFYYAVVNYYNKKRNIVLLGEQNSDVMYYGNAVHEDIFIPDVFYELPAKSE